MIEKAKLGSFKELRAVTIVLMALDKGKSVTQSDVTYAARGKLKAKESNAVLKALENGHYIDKGVHYTPARGRNTVRYMLMPSGIQLLNELLK